MNGDKRHEIRNGIRRQQEAAVRKVVERRDFLGDYASRCLLEYCSRDVVYDVENYLRDKSRKLIDIRTSIDRG